jgi:predicted RNA-binding protein associated with RNAse of E/G family
MPESIDDITRDYEDLCDRIDELENDVDKGQITKLQAKEQLAEVRECLASIRERIERYRWEHPQA